MAITTLIASGKGGVGKSTVTKNLGLQFAASGRKTLLIDLDAGLSSLDIILFCREKVNFTWADIADGSCETKDALLQINENLFLIPAPVKPLTEEYENTVADIVKELDGEFDVILLDAPAGVGRGLVRGAKAAKKALVIATADEVSVSGAATVSEVLKIHDIDESRLLINRYEVKSAKKGKLLTVDEIIDKTLVQLIGIIPEDKHITYGTVTAKKQLSKKSFGAFWRISRRIQGEYVPLELSQLK